MREIFITLFIFLVIAVSTARADDPPWLTNYADALETAQNKNKIVLMNFSGSDWCGWCKRLEREVFNTEVFKDFAREELVLLLVDFPKYKSLPAEQEKANAQLRTRTQVNEFPTVLLLQPDNEQLLLRTGYRPGGAEAYIQHLRAAMPPSSP